MKSSLFISLFSDNENEAKIDIKSLNTENNELVAQNISKTKRKETQS